MIQGADGTFKVVHKVAIPPTPANKSPLTSLLTTPTGTGKTVVGTRRIFMTKSESCTSHIFIDAFSWSGHTDHQLRELWAGCKLYHHWLLCTILGLGTCTENLHCLCHFDFPPKTRVVLIHADLTEFSFSPLKRSRNY